MTKNRIEYSFGPVGKSAGFFISVIGIIMSFYDIFAIIITVFGAFFLFTDTCTFIDSDNKRVKFSNNIFGLIRIGKWIAVHNSMSISIMKSNRAWNSYSRGNRILNITDNSFLIVIVNSNGKIILPLKKCDTIETAKTTSHFLSKELGLVMLK
jgi:hypothetical protein